MKKIKSILAMILGACIMLASCQELETPYYNIPTIETGNATNITATSALLHATIKKNQKTDWLVYILSTSPDMTNSWEETFHLEPGDSIELVHTVSGLSPNTTYYYMAALRNNVSISYNNTVKEIYGEVKSFTTLSNISLNSVSFTDWNDETELVTWDMLGTSLITENHTPYSNYLNMYTTRDYDNVNQKDYWKLPYDIAPPANTNLILCGHFPDSKKVDGSLRIRLNTYKENEEIMWGHSDIINAANPTVNLTMKHVLTRIDLSVTAGESFNSKINMVDIGNTNIEEQVVPAGGYLNIATGQITQLEYGYNRRTIDIVLSNTPTIISMYLIPTKFGEKQAYLRFFKANEEFITVDLPASNWEAGRVYTYPVTVEEASITIGDVYVEGWNNNEGGDITVYE